MSEEAEVNNKHDVSIEKTGEKRKLEETNEEDNKKQKLEQEKIVCQGCQGK